MSIKTVYVRCRRIGLLSHPWQGRVLPLNQHRKLKFNYVIIITFLIKDCKLNKYIFILISFKKVYNNIIINKIAPVAQRIEYLSSEQAMWVRFLPGAL